MPDKIKLKPCPFCGCTELGIIKDVEIEDRNDFIKIYCDNCGSEGTSVLSINTELLAQLIWNNRYTIEGE